jgi:hypothetical protein
MITTAAYIYNKKARRVLACGGSSRKAAGYKDDILEVVIGL